MEWHEACKGAVDKWVSKDKKLQSSGEAAPQSRKKRKTHNSFVFSEESLDSPESLENGRILLCFPQSEGSLDSGLFWKDPFSRRPLFPYQGTRQKLKRLPKRGGTDTQSILKADFKK